MKKLIILLALFGFIYSQDKVYTFTEEEVTNMANKVKDLQTQVENQPEQIDVYEELMKKYENQTQIDSMLLSFKTRQVDILKDREVLYEKQIKLVKPKWYENKWLYFTFGVIATSTSIKLAGEIVD
jgi:peptidoglycan hydrolase CwlO-like protein